MIQVGNDDGAELGAFGSTCIDVLNRQEVVVTHEYDGGICWQHFRIENAFGPEEVAHQSPRDAEFPGTDQPHHVPEKRFRLLVEKVHTNIWKVKQDCNRVNQDAS